jgi:hypothetical protein
VSCKRVGDASDQAACYIRRQLADRIIDGHLVRRAADHARPDDQGGVRERDQRLDDLERNAQPLPANARSLCSIANGI